MTPARSARAAGVAEAADTAVAVGMAEAAAAVVAVDAATGSFRLRELSLLFHPTLILDPARMYLCSAASRAAGLTEESHFKKRTI